MKEYNDESPEELMQAGYRQVSRKFRTIARVDIPDKKMVSFFLKNNFGDGRSGVPSCSLEGQRDQYRRCFSEDAIENVPEFIMEYLR